MEEVYQVTSALKYLDVGKQVALVTDARFSGVSTGACIGHVGPEALAGGPIGRLRDGDRVRVVVDCTSLEGRVDLVGADDRPLDDELASRVPRPDLAPDPELPADTRLWAALQNASGGTWGGCVYDVDAITGRLANHQPLGLANLTGSTTREPNRLEEVRSGSVGFGQVPSGWLRFVRFCQVPAGSARLPSVLRFVAPQPDATSSNPTQPDEPDKPDGTATNLTKPDGT